ncbi:hypothetical protein BBJ28_00009023 [Nothophytophthora sp. Chile5]|nr:hypothetical protein BBJ28_00009023 [Nothophytophthora sp. Chile5]
MLVAAFSAATWPGVATATDGVWTYYAGNTCDGTPYNIYVEEDSDCTPYACTADGNASFSGTGMMSIDCTSDYEALMKELFGSSPYILVEVYGDSECSTLSYAQGFFASKNCEGSPNSNPGASTHVIAQVEANGSASLQYFEDYPCKSSQWSATYMADKETLDSHECAEDWSKWYYSYEDNSVGSSGSTSPETKDDVVIGPGSGLSTGALVGIVAGCLVVLLIVLAVVFCRKRRSKAKRTETQLPTASLQTGNTASLDGILRGQTGLWDDDVITAKRIPRDKVRVQKLISRGAFGEVYTGVFNGQQVAVKILPPETRGNLQHVNEFLAEAKMTASMDHPRIVSFIGVAWDALSDLCVVLEFMDGGDLRTLLQKFETSRRPVGFDREKTTIALHGCHALTYLHSLMPPVIHRDLKSRNILLNRSLEAKLTDFGISRERLDQTMTAGVGTSLWMAPEVMVGERYDAKADMFSFGVVLSELDLHTLPYAQAKENARMSTGRQMPDAVLLQQIAMGATNVEFSQSSPRALVELGRACVSVDPSDRPTAAEALYRLQVILAKEFT